jgi:hypothetical protein
VIIKNVLFSSQEIEEAVAELTRGGVEKKTGFSTQPIVSQKEATVSPVSQEEPMGSYMESLVRDPQITQDDVQHE